jgi:MFS family permease
MYLTLFWAVLPIVASVMFFLSPMPEMDVSSDGGSANGTGKRTLALAICVGCIFFGSCAENSMSNWVSTFMENALHVDKTLGDILGMAMFAILLGLARITYAKYGKNIIRILFAGMIGASVCYLTIGLSDNTVLSFLACILTGLFTAMLWPGALIMMEEKIPGAGVAAFALMASGGDLGASVSPQLMGIVTDNVAASELARDISAALSISTEQVGLKAGMLVTSIFPIIGCFIVLACMRYFKKNAEYLK